MSIDRALVDAALANVADPNTGRPFAAAKNLKNITVDGATVSVEVVLGYPAKRQFEAVRRLVKDRAELNRPDPDGTIHRAVIAKVALYVAMQVARSIG